jgi:Tfp pilus assembly protein PilZ
MGHDTRCETRRAKPTTVELISQLWDEPVELLATDLSPGGLFLTADLLLEAGEPVVACFHLPGHGTELQLFGEVVWIAMPRRWSDFGLCGMGVEFVKTRPLERITIRHALRGVPPPLPYKVVATRSNTSCIDEALVQRALSLGGIRGHA